MDGFDWTPTIVRQAQNRLAKFLTSITARLRRNIERNEQSVHRAWTVDRDGRVRTDKDRPVILRAK